MSFGPKRYVHQGQLGGTGYDEWKMKATNGNGTGMIKFVPSSRMQNQYGDNSKYEEVDIHFQLGNEE